MTAGSVRYRDLESGSCLEGPRHPLCFFPVESQKNFPWPTFPHYLKIHVGRHSYSSDSQRGKMQCCTVFPLCPALALSRLRQSVATAKHAFFPELMPCRVASNASRVSDGQVKKSPGIRTLASCGHLGSLGCSDGRSGAPGAQWYNLRRWDNDLQCTTPVWLTVKCCAPTPHLGALCGGRR